MICASITEESVDAMTATANECDCDLVELRLDYLAEPSDSRRLSKIRKPVIATCMPSWEGGRFKGSEEERINVLESALDFSDYITVELKTDPKKRDALMRKAKEKGVKVIVACHDFTKTPTPEEIKNIISSEKSCGADIAKIAFTPKSEEDVLNTLHPLVEEEMPLITISMGELGKPSRILGPLLGSYLTYGYSSKKRSAAPSQFSVTELKRILGGLK